MLPSFGLSRLTSGSSGRTAEARRFKMRGLVKARGQQRTDSTRVLAAVHDLHLLELVAETLRATLADLALIPGFDDFGVRWSCQKREGPGLCPWNPLKAEP
jgi:hypothetical protein